MVTTERPYLDFSVIRFELLQDLPDGVASPLAGYHDTRVEDQSHGSGFHGFRSRTISSTSAAKSGSSPGACPDSFSWASARAIHSEMVRRTGAAARMMANGCASRSITTSAPA